MPYTLYIHRYASWIRDHRFPNWFQILLPSLSTLDYSNTYQGILTNRSALESRTSNISHVGFFEDLERGLSFCDIYDILTLTEVTSMEGHLYVLLFELAPPPTNLT